ncbi:uncharacterized protein DUF3987 [Lentzea atacamensis]|uniref:Uncharacterized protein DUF3987 n=2 Tax=Lentzea TaxID=165301 RepID=A0ABX9DXM5_9PSEU|nr:DUF3987 domain-containing protein [Lentzea atacamensis]RAS57107.1 uncharacterized protein DUF3987 [Lentzea atacamensis]
MTHASTTPPTGPASGGRRLYPVTEADSGNGTADGRPDTPIAQAQRGNGTAAVVALPERQTATADGSVGQADAAALDAAAAGQIARARLWLPSIESVAFDCYLGNLADRMDPHTEADPVGVLASLVSAAGVYLGPGPHLQLGFERHPLLVWPLLIGATGLGRKGTATNAALTLVGMADNSFRASNVHSGLSTGEGLAAVFAADAEDGKAGSKPRLLPEGDCRLLAEEPEWATVMARMKREGNTLSATLRAAWEGGNLSTLNVDARMARQSHLGIVAHITPGEFTAKVSASDLAGGTYNRFLPVAVAASKFFPAAPDAQLMTELAASLAERLRRASQLGALGCTEAAELEWKRLQLEFTGHLGRDRPQVDEFISRAGVTCLRIAAIYAALDRTDRITPAHMAAAAALVRYSIASARSVLAPNDAAAKVLAYVTAAGPDGCTATEITKEVFKGNTKRAGVDVTQLLGQLCEAGRLTSATRPGKGRPTVLYTAVTSP